MSMSNHRFILKYPLIGYLAALGLLLCWWLFPLQSTAVVPMIMLTLLACLTFALPVGRLGTRSVSFASAVVFFTVVLYGPAAATLVSIAGGLAARRLRQERRESRLQAPILAVSAQLAGVIYYALSKSGISIPHTSQDWFALFVAALLYYSARSLLLWSHEHGASRIPLRQILRMEGLVDAVTLPTVVAALLLHREWSWLSLLLVFSVTAVGLLAARALIAAHLAQRQVRALRAIHQNLITHVRSDRVLEDFGDELRRLLAFDRLSLWVYVRYQPVLQLVSVRPIELRSVLPASMPVEGMVGKVIDRGRPAVLADHLQKRVAELREYFRGHLFLIPLALGDYTWGLLVLERDAHREPFALADYQIIGVLVDHLVILLENVRLYRETAQMAELDGLTHLLNHRRWYERLHEELSRSLRYRHPMSLLMIDVDYFKRYNDTYGHQQGDELLRMLAQVLRQNTRQTDVVGRYGGEEFAVILPETNKDSAVHTAQRLCESVAKIPFPGFPGGPPVRCTISIGVATYPEDALNAAELITAADAALYRAKRFGKNRVAIAL